MPTMQPRYTLTDTGEIRSMLDAAQRRWPEEHDRKQLLLRLLAAGSGQVVQELLEHDRSGQIARQRAALARARDLVDVDVLLSDAVWA